MNEEQPTVGALGGLLVVDFTRVFSGPFASQILGDMGADVIKIERPGVGDEARDYGVMDSMVAPGAAFLAYNRNKRSIALDLKSKVGVDIAKRLISQADIVLHNFRPGVMERLGLAYEDVRESNAGLVYCSISGYGVNGSLRERGANDLVIQAYSGLLSITGEEGGGPVRNPTSICDLTAGLYAVIGIVAAINRRWTTGEGQEVAVSMLEGQLGILNHFLVDYWMTGRTPKRMGTANEMGLPNEAFPTSDGWVCISSANNGVWRRLCGALGIGELADDPRFRTLRDRYANRSELVRLVREATEIVSTRECVDRLSEAGVACAPVNSLSDIAEDPLLDELGATVTMDVEQHGEIKLVRTPITMSVDQPTGHRPPPRLAEHTDEILRKVGYSASEIESFRALSAVS